MSKVRPTGATGPVRVIVGNLAEAVNARAVELGIR